MSAKLQQLIRDPDGRFRNPVELLERSDLSDEDKITILQSWQTDLIELQKAVEENMQNATGDSGETAARLAAVTAAIAEFRERFASPDKGSS